MAVAFDARTRREFTPPRDLERPEAERTVYILRQCDIFERARLADFRSKNPDANAVFMVEMLRSALAGWRNLPLPSKNGDPRVQAEFATRADGLANDETMRCVRDDDAASIISELISWEEVSQKEAGES